MKIRLERLLATRELQPAQLFFAVLLLIFSVEAAVMVVLPFLLPNQQDEFHYAIIDACLLTGILAPLLWGLVIVPLRSLAATRLRLLDQILLTQEEERGRIARELHDSLGQLLTCLQVGLRAVQESTTDELLQQRLRDLRNVGSETHREIRRISSGLRPTVLDDVGLQAALERHCHELNRTSQVSASCLTEGDSDRRLPPSIETACYRIVQEATSNALRHGHATQINITLKVHENQVELNIRDNGCGFAPQFKSSGIMKAPMMGLWSIQERVELLSGVVTLDTTPGNGTSIVVTLPLMLKETEYGQNPSVDCR